MSRSERKQMKVDCKILHWEVLFGAVVCQVKDTHLHPKVTTKFNTVTANKRTGESWVLGAHTYSLRYSGGRDQEDWGSRPAQANSL
jgi:hypothetical protein